MSASLYGGVYPQSEYLTQTLKPVLSFRSIPIFATANLPQNETCRFELVCARCATSCEEIPTGASFATDTTIPVCVELPEGAFAESSGTNLATLSLEEGYYRTSAKSREVLECYQAEACVGGTAAEQNCASGYEGPCKCMGVCFYIVSHPNYVSLFALPNSVLFAT